MKWVLLFSLEYGGGSRGAGLSEITQPLPPLCDGNCECCVCTKCPKGHQCKLGTTSIILEKTKKEMSLVIISIK